jgi:hypothetical protein
MDAQIEKTKRVKQQHESEWMDVQGVQAVGIGRTSRGNIGIIVSVSEINDAISNNIPDTIESIEVEIQKTGEFRAL